MKIKLGGKKEQTCSIPHVKAMNNGDREDDVHFSFHANGFVLGKPNFSTSPNSRLTNRQNALYWRFLLLIYENSVLFYSDSKLCVF